MRRAQSGNTYTSNYGQDHQVGDAALESENDRLTDELKGKIGFIRSLAIEIGGEVTGQNRLLSEMDDEFDSAGGFLGKAMSQVKKLSKGSHNHVVLYLILFSLAVFFIIWILIKIA